MRNLSLVLSAVLSVGVAQAAYAGKLDEIFTRDMIGADIAYLQQFTGVPRTTLDGLFREYKVGQCTVTVYGEKIVTSLELEVSPKCTFDLGKMIDGAPNKEWAHQLTMGWAEGAHFSSDCIYMCGNAVDPSVYATLEGPRANGFLQIQLQVVLDEDKASDAADQWREHMVAKEGEDYVMETLFNKSNKYDDIAVRLFRDVPVRKIRIGYDIPEPGEPETY